MDLYWLNKKVKKEGKRGLENPCAVPLLKHSKNSLIIV